MQGGVVDSKVLVIRAIWREISKDLTRPQLRMTAKDLTIERVGEATVQVVLQAVAAETFDECPVVTCAARGSELGVGSADIQYCVKV